MSYDSLAHVRLYEPGDLFLWRIEGWHRIYNRICIFISYNNDDWLIEHVEFMMEYKTYKFRLNDMYMSGGLLLLSKFRDAV